MMAPHMTAAGANPVDVFSNVLTVNRPQASNLGPGIADIQVAPYQIRHQNSPLDCSKRKSVCHFSQ